MEKKTTSPRKKTPEEKNQVITVKLDKYESLVTALSDRKTSLRIVLTILFIGILLFVGIAIITLSVKRLYPYSDITTNGLGATTIKSEKNEVSYWLFNTAILWADSGIQVTEGDILTIRASGKSHTAIHHLYDSAKENKELADQWVGSEGESDKPQSSYVAKRRAYRIFPNMDSGALLMQVAVGDKVFDTPKDPDAKEDCFYFIGKERQNIYINSSGTLRFAVNDIVLDRHTIANMMRRTMSKPEEEAYVEERDTQLKKEFDDWVIREGYDKYSTDPKKKKIGEMEFQWTGDICELSYYFGDTEEENDKRRTAWYDDNIGSLLIMVEKTR